MKIPAYIVSLYNRIKSDFLKGCFYNHIIDENTVLFWRSKILFSIILTGITTGLLAYFPAVFLAVTEKLWTLLIIDTIAFGLGFFLLFSAMFDFKQKAGLSLLIIYLVGLGIISQVGPLSGGPIWLFFFAVIAGALLGPRAALVALGINIVTVIVVVWVFSNTHEVVDVPFFKSIQAMLAAMASFLFLNGLAAMSVSVLIGGLEITNLKEKELAKNLIKEHIRLVDARKRYYALFESANDAILILKRNFEIIDCNLKAVDMYETDKEEIIGNSPVKFSPEIQQDGKGSGFRMKEILDRLYKQKSAIFEWTHIKKNRDLYEVEVSLSLIEVSSSTYIMAIVRDITLRKQLNEMMLQNEKMASIGGLAAGMAHEINNPLAGIIQNIEVAMNRVTKNLPVNLKTADEIDIPFEKILEYLEKRKVPKLLNSAKTAGNKAAKIVSTMLSFSYEGNSDFEMTNICELLDETIELAKNDYDLKKQYDFRQIEIQREYDTTVPGILCEKSAIQQVLFNLLKNGAQAMAGNRKSVPDTGMVSGKNRMKFFLRIKNAGTHICIEVEDIGPGIDESIINRIFEPFFTTKKQGVGTGLGLWVSYFIIQEKHQGTLTVESRDGKGTRFIIHLPLSTAV